MQMFHHFSNLTVFKTTYVLYFPLASLFLSSKFFALCFLGIFKKAANIMLKIKSNVTNVPVTSRYFSS